MEKVRSRVENYRCPFGNCGQFAEASIKVACEKNREDTRH